MHLAWRKEGCCPQHQGPQQNPADNLPQDVQDRGHAAFECVLRQLCSLLKSQTGSTDDASVDEDLQGIYMALYF